MTLPSDGPQAGIPSWARVGAKVVCVSKVGRGFSCDWEAGPEVGEIYTVSSAFVGIVSGQIIPAITLSECPVIDLLTGEEWAGYDLARFRPLVTLEDDITTYFAELLDVPAGQKVEA